MKNNKFFVSQHTMALQIGVHIGWLLCSPFPMLSYQKDSVSFPTLLFEVFAKWENKVILALVFLPVCDLKFFQYWLLTL